MRDDYSTCRGRRLPCNRGLIMAALLLASGAALGVSAQSPSPVPYNALGERTGEVTSTSALIHTRLTRDERGKPGEPVPGLAGRAQLEYAPNAPDRPRERTRWRRAVARNDYCLHFRLQGLQPDTEYEYRLRATAADGSGRREGPVNRFRTAPARWQRRQVTFGVMTGQKWLQRDGDHGYDAYQGMLARRLDFLVLTGDTVYYDSDPPRARTKQQMRFHWHRQYALANAREFFSRTPAYWEKDDHDYRFDDCDPYRPGLPTHEEGIQIFHEQNPVNRPSYRTFRWGELLQIWLPEGRDYRSANADVDAPGKTIWGAEQMEWLKRGLRNSRARFKVLISPTPLVGPDAPRKRDNHTNPGGFRSEANAFFAWLKQHDIKNLVIACGDRHWSYHSVHPTGYHELSSGALSDGHALLKTFRNPLDSVPGVKVLHTAQRKRGGFLLFQAVPGAAADGSEDVLRFELCDTKGVADHQGEFRYQP